MSLVFCKNSCGFSVVVVDATILAEIGNAISKERQVCYPLFGIFWRNVGDFWPDNSKVARNEQPAGFGECSWIQTQRLMVTVSSLLAEQDHMNRLRHDSPNISFCIRHRSSTKAEALWLHRKLMDLVKQLIQNAAIQQLSLPTQVSLSSASIANMTESMFDWQHEQRRLEAVVPETAQDRNESETTFHMSRIACKLGVFHYFRPLKEV